MCLDSFSLVRCPLLPLLLPGLLDTSPLGLLGCALRPNCTGVGGSSGSSFSASLLNLGRPRGCFIWACFEICRSLLLSTRRIGGCRDLNGVRDDAGNLDGSAANKFLITPEKLPVPSVVESAGLSPAGSFWDFRV